MTAADAVAGIAATTTYQGLKCTAVLDEGDYPDGVKVSDERMKHLEERVITRHGAHGEWNYAIRPAPAGPEPEPPAAPPPAPDLQALAALAGISDLAALLDAVAVPWAAAREQRLHLDRGAARRKASGCTPWRLPFEAIVAAACCHIRLAMPYRLLGELLGAHESTISLTARRVIPLLAAHAITAQPGRPRIATMAQLLTHARAAGITIEIPPPGEPQQHARNPARPPRDTP